METKNKLVDAMINVADDVSEMDDEDLNNSIFMGLCIGKVAYDSCDTYDEKIDMYSKITVAMIDAQRGMNEYEMVKVYGDKVANCIAKIQELFEELTMDDEED